MASRGYSVLVMLYLPKTSRARCPVISIATTCGTPERIRFRTAERRKSGNRSPGAPFAVQAVFQVFRQSPRGWLAFDPKGLVGERAYDCANTLCNPVMPALVHSETRLLANAAILAGMLALDPWRVLAFTYAYACLNASRWLRLGGNDIVQWHLDVAMIIEPHIEPS